MRADGETLWWLVILYLETILLLVIILLINLFISGINDNLKTISSCSSMVSNSDICSLYDLDNYQ